MNKKYKDLIKHRQIGINEDADDMTSMLKNLEQAWEAMPEDLYHDERTFFIDLVEKVAKMHNTMKKSSDSSTLKN